MKIALFTDIHGNYQALKSILKDINKYNFDEIIFLGDCIGLGPDSNKCLREIYKNNIRFILGNHEIYYTRGHDIIKTKNSLIREHNIWANKTIRCKIKEDNNFKYVIKYKGKKLLFTHYFLKKGIYPYENSDIFENDKYKEVMSKTKCDYMFYGHLHHERKDVVDNKIFYSLDSSGCTKNDETCYYILTLEEKIELKKVVLKYDREKFENRIKNINFPNKKEILRDFYGIN